MSILYPSTHSFFRPCTSRYSLKDGDYKHQIAKMVTFSIMTFKLKNEK